METWKIFIIPLAVMLLTQVIKGIVDYKNHEFNWQVLLSYGGMPSGHTSLVASVATVVGLSAGWTSPMFLLAIALAILVVRDALGFRMQLSRHAVVINQIIKQLPDDQEYAFPYMKERIGHTYAQVIAGGVLGIIISWILYFYL